MNSQPLSVRTAVAGDAPQIAHLLGELGYPATEAFALDRLTFLADRPDDAVFVVDCAGELAGFLSFHISPLFHAAGNMGRITAMAVGRQFQRRGVGRQLVAAAEQFAWTHGCLRIEVTSGDHRLDAHAFYEAMGFRVDIRRFIKSPPESNTLVRSSR